MCYFSFKADLKARKEVNNLKEYYLCKRICERCPAVQPRAPNLDPFTYKNFAPSAPYMQACVTHEEYLRRTPAGKLSAWSAVAGWTVGTCSYDFMHLVYLGIARSLVPSTLKALRLMRFWPEATSDERFLKMVSREMHATCKAHKHLV